MRTAFFTGFPGFLGAELLPHLLERDTEVRVCCLVQPKYADLARRRVAEMELAHPRASGRIFLVEGDISEPGLGLGSDDSLRRSICAIYHLAAVYDLSAGRDLAFELNVGGTRNMLELAISCPQLERFHYISTCYVSGTHRGPFSEDDLDRGQGFHNFYEETKFLAEVEVRNCMRNGLRATIYRPSIVVGDSRTGVTQKYDGPYSIIRLLLRQPRLAIMPMVGNPCAVEVNVVPRDFTVDAIAYLSGRPESLGRTFHLADPRPLTVEEMLRELCRATRRRVIRVRLPLSLARFCLRSVPGVERLLQIPAATLDYFAHPARYTTAATQAVLQAGGIRCPRFSEYAETLVDFVAAHPEVRSAAMV